MARNRRNQPTVPSSRLVDVPVPQRLAVRTVSFQRPIQYYSPTSYYRIPLSPPRSRMVVRRVAVRDIPRYIPVRPSVASIRRDHINLYPARAARATLSMESNRRRYEERKFRRNRASAGQIDSMRRDTFGMVAEAVRLGYTAAQIADVAMVSRAMERMFR